MSLLKLFLVIVTCAVATEALQCYTCGHETACPEPFDSTKEAKPTCPGVNQDVCTAYKYEDGRVTRGCDTFDILKEDVDPNLKKGECVKVDSNVDVCLCIADGCNDGNIFDNGSDNVLVITLVSIFGSIAAVVSGVLIWCKAKKQ